MAEQKELVEIAELRVRFSETDPIGIVWHGHYLLYFEEGREHFGRKHGISYLQQKEAGFSSPIVSSSLEHKRPLTYGDVVTIRTTYVNSPAANMIFKYEILNKDGQVVCIGRTKQVFVKLSTGELHLTHPDFFRNWKEKMGLLDE